MQGSAQGPGEGAAAVGAKTAAVGAEAAAAALLRSLVFFIADIFRFDAGVDLQIFHRGPGVKTCTGSGRMGSCVVSGSFFELVREGKTRRAGEANFLFLEAAAIGFRAGTSGGATTGTVPLS